MREKTEREIITFHTTTEAIAAEKAFREGGLLGRLIPVPGQIKAGCGLSWSAPKEERQRLLDFLKARGLTYESEGIYVIVHR